MPLPSLHHLCRVVKKLLASVYEACTVAPHFLFLQPLGTVYPRKQKAMEAVEYKKEVLCTQLKSKAKSSVRALSNALDGGKDGF